MLKMNRRAITLTLGLPFAGLLAACGGPNLTDSTGSPSPAVSRNATAGILGVNVMLVNNSENIINFGLSDLPPGGTTSVAGHTQRTDVYVTAKFSDDNSLHLRVWNSPIGTPAVKQAGCDQDIRLDEGASTDRFFPPGHGITVERLADDDRKQFRITFTSARAKGAKEFCS